MTAPEITEPVRWGLLGASGIAERSFLPALEVAGGGTPLVIGARDGARAARFASDLGVAESVEGYRAVLQDARVEAVYVALPNGLHAEWAIAALEAGKAVFCEKPMCATPEETEAAIRAARDAGRPLWEAFVFPFHAQFAAVQKLLADGAVGELLEIQSDFHFMVRNPANIRLARDLDGGALNDVGCYPVRIALELFGAGHTDAWATAVWGGHDVDVDTQGSLGFPGGRRLLLTCGMRRAYDTFTRLLGTAGQIQLTNPFHPGRGDSYTVLTDGEPPRTLDAGAAEPSFTGMIRHIQNVLRGGEAPRQLALDTSLASARALHDLHQSMAATR